MRPGVREIDVLLVPGAPTIYKIEEIEADPTVELDRRLGRYASFANPLDLAAITLPAGLRPDGLPFGISLVGPAFSDACFSPSAGDSGERSRCLRPS